jgi:hypothetical protein
LRVDALGRRATQLIRERVEEAAGPCDRDALAPWRAIATLHMLIAYGALLSCVLNFAASATPTLDRRTELQGRMDSIQNRAVLLQDNALSREDDCTRVLGEPSESTPSESTPSESTQ